MPGFAGFMRTTVSGSTLAQSLQSLGHFITQCGIRVPKQQLASIHKDHPRSANGSRKQSGKRHSHCDKNDAWLAPSQAMVDTEHHMSPAQPVHLDNKRGARVYESGVVAKDLGRTRQYDELSLDSLITEVTVAENE
ncbi:hypothetical protein N0V93_007839 [Gnomoniopsis smithogilvyi]|uniref:Uncharacterized protein n=1 Tax=Gnomoniopsis smithogilvyi TaxID=1191159 RepID=A0A9W8YNW5_9PEZI|nr:hypothetical protein N0V93_007839 [Gnomoniopsis smithogilvyi]